MTPYIIPLTICGEHMEHNEAGWLLLSSMNEIMKENDDRDSNSWLQKQILEI